MHNVDRLDAVGRLVKSDRSVNVMVYQEWNIQEDHQMPGGLPPIQVSSSYKPVRLTPPFWDVIQRLIKSEKEANQKLADKLKEWEEKPYTSAPHTYFGITAVLKECGMDDPLEKAKLEAVRDILNHQVNINLDSMSGLNHREVEGDKLIERGMFLNSQEIEDYIKIHKLMEEDKMSKPLKLGDWNEADCMKVIEQCPELFSTVEG